MNKHVKAIADLANLNLQVAQSSNRMHPLWEEEIHIEEELINLEESFESNIIAEESLKDYPVLRKNLLLEQRAILRHCVGLLARMAQKKRLPRKYDEHDTMYAATKLTRLLVDEAHRVGKEIDDEVLVMLRPFLSIRQRWHMKEWEEFDVRLSIRMALKRFNTRLQFE